MNLNDKQLNIINTAEKLFACKGFDGTSIRDIAEAANVNIAMISYYFGSKEKLMQALFEQRTQHMTLRFENLIQNEKLNPWEKICFVIDDYIERVKEKQQFFKIMLHEQILEKNTLISELLTELRKKNTAFMELIVKDGQKKKLFKKNVDVVLLTNTMTGIAMQTLLNKAIYRNYHGLEELSEADFDKVLKEKTSNHIKTLYKAILNYEA
ncbi:MAG TPA: TetR family transcriptional regulator [Flavisolibacter sp.]|nr:TetR family transcriptional regulator [Flavisolibacter sp.]